VHEAGRTEPWSPWSQHDGWRLNGSPQLHVVLRLGDSTETVHGQGQSDGSWKLQMADAKMTARLGEPDAEGMRQLQYDSVKRKFRILCANRAVTVIERGRNHVFTVPDPLAPPARVTAADSKLVAPTPARVAMVFVQAGTSVKKGERLLILEAMKVETRITAPRDGEIEAVHVSVDELVPEGAQLVTFRVEEAGL
jgi:3-methylcrotonyl-CoA carboxylase alpha subunit